MFSKILIANRGEIACRVIRSAKRMGIQSVAVYSDADRDALHVEEADEAVAIGAAPAAESYLVQQRIIDACKETGAEALHPGYGFLSENPGFAEALEKAGIVFIGPTAHAIAAMGDKIESKKLAQAAGVNTVPGHLDAIADAETAVGIAREIGYPVMLKASAGGGGKGMRIAFDDAEAQEGFQSASNEARNSFGDDRVFVEKYVEQPRHIEIQILADAHGNCVHLGERECSIQRRHQKVIEEAPSPFVDEKMRAAMGAQAVALANAVQYRSAGTVEFIVDKNQEFYFLEMNTRLQVEHPITELVTGVDLVEEMLRVAAGEKLRFNQSDIVMDGWAVESRVYAEDPRRGFLPSIGRLRYYRPPAEGQTVDGGTIRIDSGVYEGAEISMFYDPMIAKLVTFGKDRITAIDTMQEALDSYAIHGIGHNIDFLNAIMRHPRFRAGTLTTNFIPEEFPDGFSNAPLDQQIKDRLLATALLVHLRLRRQELSISDAMDKAQAGLRKEWVVTLFTEEFPVAAELNKTGVIISLQDRTLTLSSDWKPGGLLVQGQLNGQHLAASVARQAEGYRITHGGVAADIAIRTPRAAALAALMPEKTPPDMSKYLLCPMPGLVVSIFVEAGAEVTAGQPLAVVEAMKMENVLRAERDGIVASVAVAPGDSLAVDQVIMEFA